MLDSSLRLAVIALVTAGLAACTAPPRRSIAPAPVAPAAVAPLYFYPEQGQSASLQDRDRFECYRWATAQAGTDPGLAPPRASRTPAPLYDGRDGGTVVAGAATGAVLGAAVSRPRYAGENAAIGAVAGLLLGAIAQESRAQAIDRANAQREEAYRQALANAQQPQDNFRRAMTACMQGRGYRVG